MVERLLLTLLKPMSIPSDVDDEKVKQGSKFCALLQTDPQGIDAVNDGRSGAESSLFFAEKAFEVFLDAFMDYFNCYLCDDREHITLVPFRGILTIILFYCLGKVADFRTGGSSRFAWRRSSPAALIR